MPIAEVRLIEGRSVECKKQLIAAVTDAIEGALGVGRDSIRVILMEVPPTNWAVAGRTRDEAQ